MKGLNFSKIASLEGWCSFDKANKLYQLVIENKPKVIVEIGVFGGKSLFSQALALQENNFGTIYGIDPWSKEASIENLKDPAAMKWWSELDYDFIFNGCQKFIDENDLHSFVNLCKARSDEFIKQVDFEIDILHIDGNHEEQSSCSDVELYLPKVKNGGYIWFDDAAWFQTQKAKVMMEKEYNCVLIDKAQSDDKNNFCALYKKLGKASIPKAFCLTLKETPKRKEYADAHFKNHNLEVDFFEGIHGKKFGLSSNIPYTDDVPNWSPDDGTPHFISQGHVGCILSHYILWKVLSYLPYNEYLILEDDVVLCDNFKEKLIHYKSQLPEDWQYAFIGHCCLCSEEGRFHVSENIIQTTEPPMCTHAYMIKKSALPILIETNSLAWSHIDIQIKKRSLPKLKYYVMVPPLADQISINNPIDVSFKSLTQNG